MLDLQNKCVTNQKVTDHQFNIEYEYTYIFDSTFDQRIISLPVESEICFELDVFFKEFVLGVVVEHS